MATLPFIANADEIPLFGNGIGIGEENLKSKTTNSPSNANRNDRLRAALLRHNKFNKKNKLFV